MSSPGREPSWLDAPGAALLLLAGALLGPAGISVLPPTAIALLAPIIPVAIAAIAVSLLLARADVPTFVDAVAVLLVVSAVVPGIGVDLSRARLEALAVRVGVSVVAAALVGGAGVLLVSRTTPVTERRIFGLSLVLLLGGIADLTSTSAFVTGGTAACCWRLGVQARHERVQADTDYLRHAWVGVMLVMAGAYLTVSLTICALTAVLLLGRWLLGRWLLDRRLPVSLPGPGILAIAIDLGRVSGGGLRPVVSAVALGVIVSQLAHVIRRDAEARPAAVTA